MHAVSLAEMLIRQRHLVNSEVVERDIERAVLLDLESLVKAEADPVRRTN